MSVMMKWDSRNVLHTIIIYVYVLLISLILLTGCEKELLPVEELPRNPQLPDPLIMFDGTLVETEEDWYEKRRPELKKLFQHYVYGYFPEKPEFKYVIKKVDSSLFDSSAVYKEIDIELFLPKDQTHIIHLSMFLPSTDRMKYPLFLFLNRCGNHTVLDFEGISILEHSWVHKYCRAFYPKRGSCADRWAIQNSINRGYAIATFSSDDMDPDTLDWSNGIHAKYQNCPSDSLTRWATLTAWAWGIHRVVDYLQLDATIDQERICLTGWSRCGKAALLAAAFDERIALVIPHQSGTGGMALSRMNPEESVERINRVFPHWFNNNFKKFNDDVTRLPVDQHLLVSLVAPRPLMDNAGLQDIWASPHLALKALKAASPVYELLGERGIVGEGFVKDEIGDTEVGKLLQYQRDTKHMINLDYWNAMLDFADLHL